MSAPMHATQPQARTTIHASGSALPRAAGRKLSVVIITQNERALIEQAVAGCRSIADEIVVVDGGSTDGTADRARELGCVVFENPWPGYAKQRMFGVSRAVYDWVLLLDTDETPDAELADAIRAWKHDDSAGDALALARTGSFLDVWVPDRKPHVRLYRRDRIGMKDVPVHEAPDVDVATTRVLPGTLLHYGFRSMSDLVRRFNHYTDLEAEKSFAAGARCSAVRMVAMPIARFGLTYFVRGGLRRGVPGLAVAMLWAMYAFLHEVKLYELHWRAAGSPRQDP
ncbi:MAG: glycosyltransferase [Gemmatimonadetes bacterium]|nr:glycosyltransferase [Gemmatimonadota bacterium]